MKNEGIDQPPVARAPGFVAFLVAFPIATAVTAGLIALILVLSPDGSCAEEGDQWAGYALLIVAIVPFAILYSVDRAITRRPGEAFRRGCGGALVLFVFAAVQIPSLLSAPQRSRQKTTMMNMRTIARALDDHAATTRSYPRVEIDRLPAALGQELPIHDGWRRRFVYRSDGVTYELTSLGRCGEPDRGAPDPSDSRADIVIRNGQWVQSPAGSQMP